MKNLIKADIRYMLLSKSILWSCMLFGLFSFVNSWMSHQYAVQTLEQFNNTYNYMLEAGADIESELSTDYVIHENNTVENPLSYFKEQAEKGIYTASPQNIISSFGESCTIFAPIIAVLVGALLVSYDEKSKTSRLKVARNGKTHYVISKQISGILVLLVLLLIAFVLAVVFNRLFYNDLQTKFDLSQFRTSFNKPSNALQQIIYIILITVIFFEIGYTISNFFHCYTAISVIVSILSFFATPFFKYDPINLKCYFESKIFLFEGVVSATAPIPISLTAAATESLLIVLVLLTANYLVSLKKSAFN